MQVYDGSKSALPADPHRHLTLDESCPPLSPPQKVASAGASRSGVLYVNPNSSPERRLVRLDLCTSRISDCATSDIGGRNSGSACAAPQRWMETAREREREGAQSVELPARVPERRARSRPRNEREIWPGTCRSEQGRPSSPTSRCRAAAAPPTAPATAPTSPWNWNIPSVSHVGVTTRRVVDHYREGLPGLPVQRLAAGQQLQHHDSEAEDVALHGVNPGHGRLGGTIPEGIHHPGRILPIKSSQLKSSLYKK